MAFKSDYPSKRTWDPDEGWELFDVTSGPEHKNFELRHNERGTLYFWCVKVALESIEGVTDLGHRKLAQTIRVNFMSAKGPTEEERQLVHDALCAFGYLHNGPLGPLRLIWNEDH